MYPDNERIVDTVDVIFNQLLSGFYLFPEKPGHAQAGADNGRWSMRTLIFLQPVFFTYGVTQQRVPPADECAEEPDFS